MPNTTNYSWVMPTDGGSSDAWGSILNTLFSDIDNQMKVVADAANAKLPSAGGTLTGNLSLKSAATAVTTKGSVSGAQSLDCSLGSFFTLTCSGPVALTLDNVPTGGTAIVVYITNGAAGFTHPTGTLWAAGAPPTLSSGTDVIGYLCKTGGTAPVGIACALAIA